MEEKCPYCGGQEFVVGKQEGYATVSPADKFLTFRSQALYHKICRSCGTVVKSYVKDPEKLA